MPLVLINNREGVAAGMSQKTCRVRMLDFSLAANEDDRRYGFHKIIIFICARAFADFITQQGVNISNDELMNAAGIIRLFLRTAAAAAVALSCYSCMKSGPRSEEEFFFGADEERGVFILHEGNFMYGNSSLSYYVPSTGRLENEVFIRSNGIRLGDVAQSMTIRGNAGYVVVNNSGVIFAVDTDTFKVKKVIKGFVSPRYIHFVNDGKAYVTELAESRIAIIDPSSGQVTGYIDTGTYKSTEQMVRYGKYLFVTCWSYGDTILVIDTGTDEIVDTITTRIQPRYMVMDTYDKVWVLTDGGYASSVYGYEAPALYRIDAATRMVEKEFVFRKGDSPKALAINGGGDTLTFINRSVWQMPVTAETLPEKPFLDYNGTIYFSLGVDPVNSDVYVGDAIDYAQRGVVYRFRSDGVCIDTLRTGIIPSMFCFKE